MPFLVSATAGTTVYGAFDPLLAIADICKKYKIWMHVDVSSELPASGTGLQIMDLVISQNDQTVLFSVVVS